MSPQADHADLVQQQLAESQLSTPLRELEYVPEESTDQLDVAMDAAVLALANVDRALRRQPLLASLQDVHPAKTMVFYRAALEIALTQHPTANLGAVADAADELRQIINGLITDPQAAIVSDPERLMDACQGMVRLVLERYRNSLRAALTTVRASASPAR